MAEMAHGAHSEESGTRRDFLTLATAATGAVGAVCAIWPFVDSMNPAADTLALSTTEAALDNIAEGMAVKVM
ncbi:MAG: ubiquinol-cytochrome c reductase iron-sulfur subunit N-terminal domain-containing protein, partial [Rhodospirillales bacterium]